MSRWISAIGMILFVVITVTTIFWATGLKFNAATGSFDRTAVIAVNNSLDNVTVSLNNKVVGNETPITLGGLLGGNYQLTITKPGFHPFQKFFLLSPGEAGVIKVATLIALNPKTESVPQAIYLPTEPFDVGLDFQNGELNDFGKLVTRFSTDIAQAHRFNTAYLYQQGTDLHLYFAENNQDITVYQANSGALLQLNLSPSDWTLTVFAPDGPKQLSLTIPTV